MINNNVLHTLNENEIFTSLEIRDLSTSINLIIKEYINENIINFMYADFDIKLNNYIYNLCVAPLLKLYNQNMIFIVHFKLENIIDKVKQEIYVNNFPTRSYKYSFIRNIKYNKSHLKSKIDNLKNKLQPAQRSDEWYEFRHNLLTASSIFKVFGTESMKNQLIYEKCCPHKIFSKPSLESPLHWGQKYEKVSTDLYESMYNTKVGDFGCIQHEKYSFIGASPDGINIDENNPRYGRMLEIKNVVSRRINGIPKSEYWIQMQIQMEACDLNECDFLETKFIEYKNEEDFLNDGSYTWSENNQLKGRMILFSNNGNFHYEYAPLYININEYKEWENKICQKNVDMIWIENIYWKLEKYSNILVLRNKIWFEEAIKKIDNIWNIITMERLTGYDHRAPSKKKRKIGDSLIVKKCHINVEKLEC
jgi:putative phage-type endonuclease